MSATPGPCVLVVEDNPASAALMAYLLESFGYRTLTAADGEAGVELARSQRPALVLCDIQLPGIDGFEVARRLRAMDALRGVPLVALTAMAMIGDEERILGGGFDGYLSKPIDPQGLVALVRRHLLAPEVAAPAPAPAPTPLAEPAPPRAATILALDDRRPNLELERGLLEPMGYEVLVAETMREALALARARVPDLVISDVGMKHGDGFAFVQALKSDPALQAIPVMLLSSTHWDEASRARGLALGAARYLRRPIEPQLLLREIRALLQR